MNVMAFNKGDTFPNIEPKWCEKHGLDYFGCRCTFCFLELFNKSHEETKNSTLKFGDDKCLQENI